MHDIWRVFRYLKFYPWNIAGNLVFNMLAGFFNLFTFVTIVPFVELLFGTSQPAGPLPPFSLSQEYLSLYMTYPTDSQGRFVILISLQRTNRVTLSAPGYRTAVLTGTQLNQTPLTVTLQRQ